MEVVVTAKIDNKKVGTKLKAYLEPTQTFYDGAFLRKKLTVKNR